MRCNIAIIFIIYNYFNIYWVNKLKTDTTDGFLKFRPVVEQSEYLHLETN